MADKRKHRAPSFSTASKATQDVADRVNEALPVHISPEDVERNPQFVKLLTTLSKHINEDGVSKSVHQDFTEANNSVQHEKTHWLQQNTLHQELRDLLLDHRLKVSECTPGGVTNQFYTAVEDCLALAEIGDYLDCSLDPGVNVTLLGLKKADLKRRNPHQKHLAAIQQKLIPEIENRLRKKCETLVNFHDASHAITSESSKLSFARASQLPEVVQDEQQSLGQQRLQLKRDRVAREKQFWQYYQALMSSLAGLEKLIVKHRLQSQQECDTVTSEWLMARCDAMCLKIKLLELQLMCDTYYGETVKALTVVRRELDSAIDKTKYELSEASQALKAYESVGFEFDSLVKEYTYLKDEISNKQWAIRELKPILDLDVPTS